MNVTKEKEPHEIQLAIPPYRVTFFGCMEPPADEELLSQGVENGEPVETTLVGKLCLEVQRDGRWENVDTGEGGDIEPGNYVLLNEGLYSVPDNEAVLDRPRQS